jgi:acyl-CoA thioester hydrolase
MPSSFLMRHSVAFADTDMAGIMHFANYLRYMEATEHAFLRSLGFSVHMEYEGREIGWPRVHVECDYRQPLTFEDEFEVELRVREKRPRSLTYDFCFRKEVDGQQELIGTGTITAVCVSRDEETRRMKAVPIPERLAEQIEVAPVLAAAGESAP